MLWKKTLKLVRSMGLVRRPTWRHCSVSFSFFSFFFFSLRFLFLIDNKFPVWFLKKKKKKLQQYVLYISSISLCLKFFKEKFYISTLLLLLLLLLLHIYIFFNICRVLFQSMAFALNDCYLLILSLGQDINWFFM